MKGERILRYVRNHPEPEPTLYDPIEIMVRDCVVQQKYINMVQDLILDGMMRIGSGLYVPESCHPSAPFYIPMRIQEPPETPEEPFEVNLCEPLVGWRQWTIRDGHLTSYYQAHRWVPMEALEAKCVDHGHDHRINPGIPKEECGCGVYAVDRCDLLDTDGALSPLHVRGQVYGWGRYVRGDMGWRAQYAYPKSFFLHKEQNELVGILKPFRVPIFIDIPHTAYHPMDEGYSTGEDYEHWGEEANGNFRTSCDSDSEED